MYQLIDKKNEARSERKSKDELRKWILSWSWSYKDYNMIYDNINDDKFIEDRFGFKFLFIK